MHWCMDETLAVLAMIPFVGYLFRKLHTWYHTKFHHKCHEEGCNAAHVEHTTFNAVHDEGPEPEAACEAGPEWDHIDLEDVRERFGDKLVIKLMTSPFLLGNPHDGPFQAIEIIWFVNDKSELKATYGSRSFIYNYSQYEYKWDEVM